jgi:dolichol-phosphate mannosyltransferase
MKTGNDIMTLYFAGRQQNLYIIVPVFNEMDNLWRLLKSFESILGTLLSPYVVEIILVDDGSTDGTQQKVSQLSNSLNLTLLTHETNHGPGKAFGTAFRYLAGKVLDDDWVVTMEGDNTSRIEILHQMFARQKEGHDIILASPYMYGGGIINTVPFRVFLSNMANVFVKELLGISGILTVSSFYRLYRGSVIRDLQKQYGPAIIELAGFECMVEMLLKMMYLKMSISEVPLLLDTSLRVGKSKMKIFRTVLGYIKVWRRKKHWNGN